MSNAARTLQAFEAYRDGLTRVLDGLARAAETLCLPGRAKDFVSAKAKLHDARFRIAIVGEMKHGKSTLLNAMLGELVVPSWASVACTAAPIQVEYGPRRQATCHRHPPLAPEIVDLQAEPDGLFTRLTVPRSEHRPRPDSDAEAMRQHPYVRATVEWPVELCRHGAVLFDTPGMNEAGQGGKAREQQVWSDLACHADAVILVFSCTKFGTESEDKTLRRVLESIVDRFSLFVAINRFDEIRGTPDEERARRTVRSMFESLSLPKDRVYFVVASEALEGRRSGKPELVANSRLPELEAGLVSFLVNEKMEAKLLGSLKAAELGVIEVTTDVIVQQATGPAERVRASSEARKLAEDCETKSEQCLAQLKKRLSRISDDVAKDTAASVRRLAEELSDGIREELNNVPITFGQAVFGAADARRRLLARAEEWANERATRWERKYIDEVVQEHASSLQGEVDDKVDQLKAIHEQAVRTLSKLESANMAASGPSNLGRAGMAARRTSSPASEAMVSMLDRLMPELTSSGVMPGAFFGGIVAMWLGSILVFPLLPVVIVGAAVGAALGANTAAGRLRDSVARSIGKAITERLAALELSVAETAKDRFAAVSSGVIEQAEALGCEITAIAREIELIHAEQERRAEAHRRQCADLRSTLHGYAQDLEEIRRAIDPRHNTARLADQIAEQVRARIADDLKRPDTPAAPAPPPSSMIELKSLPNGQALNARFELCTRFLREKGAWDASKDEALAQWWLIAHRKIDPTGTAQIPAFQAVVTKAVSEGETLPPSTIELRHRFKDKDPTFMVDVVKLYMIITNEPNDDYFKDGLNRFLMAYDRAYGAVIKDPRPDEPRRGTVIHDRDREPYRPAE